MTGVCYAMYLIGAEKILVSPVHVGSGTVRCAHGIMPVPAPATANILEGVPVYGGSVKGELCTPTGAALLKHFADSFGPMPVMVTERTGIGIGTKTFEQANCIRVFLGETGEKGNGEITELVCNIDDMTPEALAYACSRLLEQGALDVYTVAGTMKKGRPGHVLTVLCRPERRGEDRTSYPCRDDHKRTEGTPLRQIFSYARHGECGDPLGRSTGQNSRGLRDQPTPNRSMRMLPDWPEKTGFLTGPSLRRYFGRDPERKKGEKNEKKQYHSIQDRKKGR